MSVLLIAVNYVATTPPVVDGFRREYFISLTKTSDKLSLHPLSEMLNITNITTSDILTYLSLFKEINVFCYYKFHRLILYFNCAITNILYYSEYT